MRGIANFLMLPNSLFFLQHCEIILDEVLQGAARGLSDSVTPEALSAMASASDSSTQSSNDLKEGALTAATALLEKIGQSYSDQGADIDQETSNQVARAGLSTVAQTAMVSFVFDSSQSILDATYQLFHNSLSCCLQLSDCAIQELFQIKIVPSCSSWNFQLTNFNFQSFQ